MSLDLIRSIREKTGLSLKDIKKAVEASSSKDEDEIITNLRKQGVLKQQSRQDRATSNGGIFSYVHEGRIGVMVEIKCETDFVARSDAFSELGNDLTLHIAAYQPAFVDPSEVDQTFIDKELEIAKKLLEEEGKPAEMISKILEGKKNKIVNEVSLVAQPFLKDPKIMVADRVAQAGQATGENIKITRFTIFVLGN